MEIKLKTPFNTSFPCIGNGTPNISPVIALRKEITVTERNLYATDPGRTEKW